MIEIKNVSKSYGKTVALSNLNLSVKDGSVLGLVGINGAGKSTLLRLLSGVFQPDSGEILIDGQKVFENEKVKKDLFFMPDEPFYTPGITGEKLADMYRAFYDFDNAAFNKYLKIFGLDDKKPVRNFSKGMKRQLFVCLAFAIKPKYLFLDEVFDGLDPFARLTFKRGLIALSEEKSCTVIIASHSLRELEDICDTFSLIDGKMVSQSGNITDALEKIYKFQIAFNEEIEKEDFHLPYLSFDSSGRVIKVIIKGDKEEFLANVQKMNPIFIDELPVNFEELFVSEIRNRENK